MAPSPPAPRNHPGERHADIRIERLQHRIPPELPLEADQLQRGDDLLDGALLPKRQQQAFAVDRAALRVAGLEDGVDGAAGQRAGVGGMQRKGAAEFRHHLVHGAAGPVVAKHLGDMGAVMSRAKPARGAVLLDLPDHQLFRIVDARVGAELARARIWPAVREPPPVHQQRALADRLHAFGGGGLQDHARSVRGL